MRARNQHSLLVSPDEPWVSTSGKDTISWDWKFSSKVYILYVAYVGFAAVIYFVIPSTKVPVQVVPHASGAVVTGGGEDAHEAYWGLLEPQIESHLMESSEVILKQTLQDVAEFVRSDGRIPSSYGLTRGEYLSMSAANARKLLSVCNFDGRNATIPPRGLILPGRLSHRKLHDFELCFLWHNERFFTRATGGVSFILCRWQP